MKAHLIGGGLASLSAAAYLIREAGVSGSDITIYERGARPGGSLNISGNADDGYIYPGGRVFEANYRCAFDLFSFVPARTDPNRSIGEDIQDFNAGFGWDNRARLVDAGARIVPQGPMGLRWNHQFQLLRLLLTPERHLQGKRIQDCVSTDFMQTPFWFIWSSIMAFRPRHNVIEMRRYMLRFMHTLPELWSMTFILRTRINQHQAIVEPLQMWLAERGVSVRTDCRVRDIGLDGDRSQFTANTLFLTEHGQDTVLPVGGGDLVFITNGSQVSALSVGSMTTAPVAPPPDGADPWELWRNLAEKRPGLGNPGVVADHQEDSTWVSFTVTDRGDRFAERMQAFTGSEAGRGGLVTFKASNWLLTLARFHQPNALDQPDDVFVWWGYGIYPERLGNFVNKPMSECSGEEILREVLAHLDFSADATDIASSSTCIPCLMPHAGSVLLWRNLSDRPKVVPEGSTNFAFIGQFCEQPNDVPFTMEYSVRSAWTAVHALTKKGRPPPPAYRGYLNPGVLLRSLRALQR